MKTEHVENYKPILAECYAADPELVSRWHTVAGQGLEACIEREFSDLKEANVRLFKVTQGEQLVGYFGKELFDGLEFLTGFFLMPSFRPQKLEFWNLIRSEFKDNFFCGIYEKNLPAMRFIKTRGATLYKRATLSGGSAILFQVGV